MLYQIIALILWSSAFIAAKYTYTMTDPLLMLLCRLVLASLLVLPAALRFGRSLEKRYWRPLLWLTFLNYVVVLAMQFVGLKYTSVTSASTIVGLEPLLMVFIGHFFFRDFARWYHWLCGLAAFVGVALLIAGSGGEGDISVRLPDGVRRRRSVLHYHAPHAADDCRNWRACLHLAFHGRGAAAVPAGEPGLRRQPAYRMELARRAGAALFGRVLQLAFLHAVEQRHDQCVG